MFIFSLNNPDNNTEKAMHGTNAEGIPLGKIIGKSGSKYSGPGPKTFEGF